MVEMHACAAVDRPDPVLPLERGPIEYLDVGPVALTGQEPPARRVPNDVRTPVRHVQRLLDDPGHGVADLDHGPEIGGNGD